MVNKFSVHAEREAIMNINNMNIIRDKRKLKRCRIVITKITNGEISETIPCLMCQKLLHKYGLGNNVYTIKNGKECKI